MTMMNEIMTVTRNNKGHQLCKQHILDSLPGVCSMHSKHAVSPDERHQL